MTLVNQDLILETAMNMGEFSTMQMAFKVYGDLHYNHLSAVHHKLQTLCNRGFVEKVGKRKDQHSNQPQTYWKAIQ